MDTKQSPKSKLAIDFVLTLEDYLTSLGLKAPFLTEYNFENVKVVLVTSVPGYHKNENLNKYGHMKVRKYLSSQPLSTEFQSSPIVAQVSSIGSLSKTWINDEFGVSFASCSGYEISTTEKDSRKKRQKKISHTNKSS